MRDSERTDCAQLASSRERVAALNDRLRMLGQGGRLLVTRDVLALPNFSTSKLLVALAAFDRFDEGNDPYGERDFGDLELCGQTLLWKIDYYDNQLEYASPDASDPLVTTRVLTVMLESEY